ncbi:hypothetical protein L1987_00253 [Smallanthus sonchifolius]|uniref:Uncharacterized protein n=1 Tax=Smallanthus sonchifolius TaxID=185202 RepID=A0ACB9K1U6_9ASTR|nr:hypothetical protein L1987_00253 [Smallanthus sonchifolius]
MSQANGREEDAVRVHTGVGESGNSDNGRSEAGKATVESEEQPINIGNKMDNNGGINSDSGKTANKGYRFNAADKGNNKAMGHSSFNSSKAQSCDKSMSFSLQSRPRKRSRTDSDPFGLDELLGLNKLIGTQSLNEEVQNTPHVSPILNFDLNNRASVDFVKETASFSAPMEPNQKQVEENEASEDHVMNTEQEVADTILVGQGVGAIDIQNFHIQVRESVVGEGIQNFYQ